MEILIKVEINAVYLLPAGHRLAVGAEIVGYGGLRVGGLVELGDPLVGGDPLVHQHALGGHIVKVLVRLDHILRQLVVVAEDVYLAVYYLNALYGIAVSVKVVGVALVVLVEVVFEPYIHSVAVAEAAAQTVPVLDEPLDERALVVENVVFSVDVVAARQTEARVVGIVSLASEIVPAHAPDARYLVEIEQIAVYFGGALSHLVIFMEVLQVEHILADGLVSVSRFETVARAVAADNAPDLPLLLLCELNGIVLLGLLILVQQEHFFLVELRFLLELLGPVVDREPGSR